MLEEVGIISKYLHDYGPLIVILSVFLFLFLTVIMYVLHTNKASIDSSRELNTQLITSILNDYFKNNNLNEKQLYNEKKIIDIFMELNRTLKSTCESVMRKSGSDRTAIYVFHNGSHATHGLPFFKMSCICETISVNSNANIKLAEHSSVPLNLFEGIVSNLYNNSEYRITISENTTPSELIFLQNTKIKDCFFVPIYDDYNNMMGFVFNGYNREDKNRDLEKERDNLINLAKITSPVIEFSKFQEYQSNVKED